MAGHSSKLLWPKTQQFSGGVNFGAKQPHPILAEMASGIRVHQANGWGVGILPNDRCRSSDMLQEASMASFDPTSNSWRS